MTTANALLLTSDASGQAVLLDAPLAGCRYPYSGRRIVLTGGATASAVDPGTRIVVTAVRGADGKTFPVGSRAAQS